MCISGHSTVHNLLGRILLPGLIGNVEEISNLLEQNMIARLDGYVLAQHDHAIGSPHSRWEYSSCATFSPLRI